MSDMPTGRDTFGRPRPGLRTIRRRELHVHLARARHRRTNRNARPTIDATDTAPAPADTAFSTSASTPGPAALTEIKRRYAICKACQHSRDNAFACALHPACCFGRWRSNPANHCPVGRW